MNPTFRRVLAAGLGTLSMTEKAVRKLVDDLVQKGDLTRAEGEKILTEAGKRWEEGRGEVEKKVDSAVVKALDRLGLAKRSDVQALEHRIQRLEGGRSRARAASTRPGRTPRRKRTPPPIETPTT